MSAPVSPQGIPDSGEKRIGFLHRYRVAFQILLVVITAGTVSLVCDWRAERNAIAAREKQQTDFRDAVRFAKSIRNDAFASFEPDDDPDIIEHLERARRLLAVRFKMDEDKLFQKFAGALRDAVCIDGGLAAVPHLQFALGKYPVIPPQKHPIVSEDTEAAVEMLILIGDAQYVSENPAGALPAYIEACEKIGERRGDLWEQAHVRLAIVYDRVRHPEKSAKIWREIVAYRIQDTHSENPYTVNAKRWLATMLWEAGQYEEAEPIMRQPPVFDKHKSLLARPRSLNDRVLIVSLLEDNGYEEEALRYAHDALKRFTDRPESKPEDLARLLGIIGRFNWRRACQFRDDDRHAWANKHFIVARNYLEDALSCLKNQPLPDTSVLAETLGSLGGLLAEMGNTEEAAAHFARARDIHQNAPGGPHPDLAIDLYRLGDVLRAPERQQEAGDLIRQGIEGLKDRKKSDRFYLAEGHWSLARWHQRNGRIEDAKDEARKAIEISTDAEGAEHGRTMKYQKYLDGLADGDSDAGKK